MPKPNLSQTRQITEAVIERRQALAVQRVRDARRERRRAKKVLSDLLLSIFERASGGHLWLDVEVADIALVEADVTAYGFIVDTCESLGQRAQQSSHDADVRIDELEASYVLALDRLGKKLKSRLAKDIALDLRSPACCGYLHGWANALQWLDQELVLVHWLTDGGGPLVLAVTPDCNWWGRRLAETDAEALRPALLGVVAAANALRTSALAPASDLTSAPLAVDERRVSWLSPGSTSTVLPVLGVSLATLSWLASPAGQAFSADLDLTSKAVARTGETSLVARYSRLPAVGGYPLTGREFDRAYLLPIDVENFSGLLERWGFGVDATVATEVWVDLRLSW